MGPRSGSNRVNRGGSWNNNARNCRSANRNRNTPTNTNNNLGFRLVSTTQSKGIDAVPSVNPVHRGNDAENGSVAAGPVV
jgi:hypothetical protein